MMKLIANRGVRVAGVSYEPGDLIECDERTATELLASGKVIPTDSVDRSIGLNTETAAPLKAKTKRTTTTRKKKAD